MLTKIVDGQTVTMSAQEEAAVRAEWAASTVIAPSVVTFKSDIWRRCTPDEAQMLDAALQEAPVYLRRLFEAITEVHHDAPEFPTLRDAIAASLGNNYSRADEILAASI